MTAKVYFTNFRTNPRLTLLDKLEKLMKRAGIGDINFENKFVAINIHFGERGNIAYIRPNYTACVVQIIIESGGKPFLTNTNTLYVGKRANAVDHLETISVHGFNRLTLDCEMIEMK